MASGRVQISKPAVHRLHAEVPCNYILGRFAAALQNVFESSHSLAPFFRLNLYCNTSISVRDFFRCLLLLFIRYVEIKMKCSGSP